MAVEYVDTQAKFSANAGADLSALQNTFVKLSTTTVIPVAAATDVPVGVVVNNPTSGKTAEVVVSGIVKIKASAAIAVGAPVGTTAGGLAVTLVRGTDTTKFICGMALTAATAANDVITVLLIPATAKAA